jgi:hypothetical protein
MTAGTYLQITGSHIAGIKTNTDRIDCRCYSVSCEVQLGQREAFSGIVEIQ